jgi:tRNA-binding EMAP/Myf-like protein
VQEVIGKQALFVINVKPRKICAVVSGAILFDIG